ncbi:MAG: flagellar basal body L-ring protein FlgH [Roseateles sp.]|uniref:flagellar basal body L-ring protein FlgH n=1 Tax=Roseateles sp. TaxID=1971397 RepID=UPI0039ED1A73
MKLVIAIIAAALLAGCATPYPTPEVELSHTPVVELPPVQPVAAGNGAIYQAAAYRPLFEDHRARLVGDTLTVSITERVSATQTSTSELSKTGTLSAGVTAVPGISPKAFARAGAEATSGNDNKGKGSNQNTNEFIGVITTVVTGVLPNGHLMISGEKQIGVNRNVDVLRFSGQVDPRLIGQGNVVPSTSVANVRIEQRGRGAVSDAHAIGWLSRFFLNLAPS